MESCRMSATEYLMRIPPLLHLCVIFNRIAKKTYGKLMEKTKWTANKKYDNNKPQSLKTLNQMCVDSK